jgi:hypothetical protein
VYACIYKVLEEMGAKRRVTERAKAMLILSGRMEKPENIGAAW